MKESSSPIDKILDIENTDNIFLFDESDNEIEFEQVAVIPMDGVSYVILSPISDIEGLSADEGAVFAILSDEGGLPYLSLVGDEELSDRVFDLYERLFDEKCKTSDEEMLDLLSKIGD